MTVFGALTASGSEINFILVVERSRSSNIIHMMVRGKIGLNGVIHILSNPLIPFLPVHIVISYYFAICLLNINEMVRK